MAVNKSMMIALLVLATLTLIVEAAIPNQSIVQMIATATAMVQSDGPVAKIVSTLDMILNALIEDGLARHQQLPPKCVGIHPSNRYGFGVSAAQVHHLGAQIVRMGWSWSACALAVCIADGATRRSAAFTAKMQRGSEKFGKSVENEIRYGSLACGHTNQFLVAALDRAVSDEEAISTDGRISIEQITNGDPQLAEALEKGLKWLVLDADVEDLYPSLPDLVQRARQAIGQVQSEESILQLCMNIQTLAASMQEDNKVANFDLIAAQVRQSCPKHPEDIHKLCSFVQLYSGGKDGQYLKDLTEFASLCVPSNRTILADMLQKFVDLKLESSELCPEFVVAVIKCNLDCPPNKVFAGICRFVKDGNIQRLQSAKKADMMESNQHLKDFKAFVKRVGVDRQTYTAQTGLADCVVARLVLELPCSADYDNLTVRQALNKIARYVLKKFGNGRLTAMAMDTVNPFHDAAFVEVGARSSSSVGLVEYDARGSATGVDKVMLQQQGFQVNEHVESIETSTCM